MTTDGQRHLALDADNSLNVNWNPQNGFNVNWNWNDNANPNVGALPGSLLNPDKGSL